MTRMFFLCLLVASCTAFIPMPAEAYLLPLIGASGAIITMLIGIVTAVLCAVYLVFYNIRRALKRGASSQDDEDEETPDTKKPS